MIDDVFGTKLAVWRYLGEGRVVGVDKGVERVLTLVHSKLRVSKVHRSSKAPVLHFS